MHYRNRHIPRQPKRRVADVDQVVLHASGGTEHIGGESGRPAGSNFRVTLPRAKDPQDPKIASRFVATGAGLHPIERTVAAAAWQLTHSGMAAERIPARMLTQPFDGRGNHWQAIARLASRAGLLAVGLTL